MRISLTLDIERRREPPPEERDVEMGAWIETAPAPRIGFQRNEEEDEA